MKKIKILIVTVMCFVICGSVCCTVCSAESYSDDFPNWCPVSGGAYFEVETSQGRACVVVPRNYRFDCFGFQSSSGYNVANITNSTVSGYIYFKDSTSYYGNPTSLQCRFGSFGTLNVYVPYQSTYGGTSYQWQSLDITSILNTNVALSDEVGERYNSAYVYTTVEKILVFIAVLLVGILLFYILRRSWCA